MAFLRLREGLAKPPDMPYGKRAGIGCRAGLGIPSRHGRRLPTRRRSAFYHIPLRATLLPANHHMGSRSVGSPAEYQSPRPGRGSSPARRIGGVFTLRVVICNGPAPAGAVMQWLSGHSCGSASGKSVARSCSLSSFCSFWASSRLSSGHPLAGLFAGSGLIVALVSWFFGWGFGTRRGRKMEDAAHTARLEASMERDRAIEDQRLAGIARENAQNQEAAFKSKCMAEETGLVHRTRDLPLPQRLQAAGTFGNYPEENWQAFEVRRDTTLQRRVQRWGDKKSFGHVVLEIVEGQGGLCGDPAKDPSGKGCGCYLYALPPAAVHLDHVVPQSKGGGDELSNIQALCSACNTRAGARTDEPEQSLPGM